MAISWKPTSWSWVAPQNKQPSTPKNFIQNISLSVENEAERKSLTPNIDEKQGSKYQISRGFFLNLENWEEKEKLYYKVMIIERKKANCSRNILKIEEREVQYKKFVSREEKENFFSPLSLNLENREEKEKSYYKFSTRISCCHYISQGWFAG